ncbi:MAG: DMT family transporter [Bacteroides sp.]|nr:DMT family transporter [Bacteroides sp.]
MNAKARGYILGAIAAATYGLNPLFALPLYAEGMTPDSVLFFRYLFALPVLAAMIVWRGRSFRISFRQGGVLFVLGLLMALSSLTLFLSYLYMDAGIASTILFVYPIMVAVIMAAVFKERISPVTTLCIAVALAGIVLLYKSEGDAPLSLAGTLIVLASSLSYALYIVWVNKSSLSNVATLTVTFYVLLFGLTLFAARLLFAGEVTVPAADRWWLWGNLAALAVLPTAVSLVCTTAAIGYIGSTPTAILGALEPVTAVIIGVCVFGEQLTPRIIIGLIMIIGAVMMVIAAPDMASRLASIRRLFPRLRRK